MDEQEYIILANLTKLRIVLAILRDTLADKFLIEETRKNIISTLAETVEKYEVGEWIDSS